MFQYVSRSLTNEYLEVETYCTSFLEMDHQSSRNTTSKVLDLDLDRCLGDLDPSPELLITVLRRSLLHMILGGDQTSPTSPIGIVEASENQTKAMILWKWVNRDAKTCMFECQCWLSELNVFKDLCSFMMFTICIQ